MIPSPGELFADWWTNAGYQESGYEDVFYHDIPPALAAEARRRERGEDSKALQSPGRSRPGRTCRQIPPLPGRPYVPRRLGAGHARERLDLEADEMDGGQYITLSRPRELAERLQHTPRPFDDGTRQRASRRDLNAAACPRRFSLARRLGSGCRPDPGT